MSQIILLTQSQIDEATAMGDETYQRWKGRPGHYRNLAGSHRRGKLGEVAVEEWAGRHGIGPIEPNFRDPSREREADLLLHSTRADVKTWDESGWEAWGRCVAPTQLPALQRKADIIIWCFVNGDDEVTVVGWNHLDEVAAAPIVVTGPSHAPVTNHQVDMDQVRDIETLADFIEAQ